MSITSPEEFFGHQLGADRKIARWDKIVDYFNKLVEESEKIKVINMGDSTEGYPFIVVIVSSEENMGNLDRIKEINHEIVDPVDLDEKEIKPLIEEGKAVVIQSMSLHATEIGGTQMAPELTYDLLTREDAETKRILDNVISIMVPCFNPDGQVMVTDWYNQWLDTKYEGMPTPFLYHKYCGHDNNRDAFMTNIVESKYMADLMFHQWPPQAYQDHHHMGSYGARLYVAPYSDPIHPHGDPLVWRELQWYGSHMAYKLEENEKTGIVNAAIFSGWAHLGFHWIGIYHNIPSMLTESASAKLATPLYIHPEQLKEETGERSLVGTRMLPHYKPTTNFPHPWQGGWWTLRDIVEQQKISAWALLDQMARNKETVLWNAYQKAIRQTERGVDDPYTAYVVPKIQHDFGTMELMIEKLMLQNIEIYQAKDSFMADAVVYEEGSYIIPLAQPKMGLIKTLLSRTKFPDDSFTRQPDGSPYRPYDTATDTMAEFMGVEVHPVEWLSEVELEQVVEYKSPAGGVDDESDLGYLLDTRENFAYKAVNMLLEKDIGVERITIPLDTGVHELPPGCFLVETGHEDTLKEVAKNTGVNFHALMELEADKKPIKQLRVGIYQRYWGGNIDEGWTRLCLEKYHFPYRTLLDADIRKGNLNEEYDLIILPNDSPAIITGGDEFREWWEENRSSWSFPEFPQEYQSGLGDEGKEALKEFVEEGGKLVCIGEACMYAIETLELEADNVLKDLSSKEFFCPGSTLNIKVNTTHPVAYGMPDNALGLFWESPAFKIKPNMENHKYSVIATYPERDILQSGWLIGEKHIAEKIAAMEVEKGKGSTVLLGIRPQHRCQTHGTFKLLFNTLLG
jgi:hypothetical protein